MFNRLKKEVAKLITGASGIEIEKAYESVEMPKGDFGDLSSRIAFDIAKEKNKSPVEIAKEIVAKLKKNKYIEKAVATGPYINFFLSAGYYSKLLKESNGADFGKGRRKKRKTIVEFPSVNPNKPWHIGHLRNALLGDSVAHIILFTGETVEVIDYIDDLGLQVAQSLYGFMNFGKTPDKKLDHWIGEQYVLV
ncbi:arginine--tRNA ligase, partial [Candidatus Micrarchaeota archaeon]|nr:arginine--tRNA ligase [Candidatus Micrarchaeota archaeon]